MSKTLEFDNPKLVPSLFGEHNIHLNHLEKKLGVTIADRGNKIILKGTKSAIKDTEDVLNAIWDRLLNNQDVGLPEFDAEIRFLNYYEDSNGSGSDDPATETGHNPASRSSGTASPSKNIMLKTKKKTITPRSPNQGKYIQAILDKEMVFGIGPAGTGKTYLAVAAGVSLYLQGKVERLIFTRPAVEAGEHLGFLPGDMQEKVDPYLRPIYDALQDTLHWDTMMKKMETGDIEIAPLAFMRGRTLSNAFVVLDEAQNTTPAQMKMFLTRMGESTRMVITGDLTQTDLPKGMKSGLRDACETLSGVDEIHFSHFESQDVIRHPLVRKIVNAYDRHTGDPSE